MIYNKSVTIYYIMIEKFCLKLFILFILKFQKVYVVLC